MDPSAFARKVSNFMDWFRHPPKKCKKCKTPFSFQNLQIMVGDLKWTQEEEKTTENVKGITYATGPEIIKVTQYKIYYRIVTFVFACPHCGEKKYWNKRYEVYDGRCRRSQSAQEQENLLKKKIKKTLGKKFVNGNPINLHFYQ